METRRMREIEQLLEACRATDNSELEAEKTAVIAELLELARGEANGPVSFGIGNRLLQEMEIPGQMVQ